MENVTPEPVNIPKAMQILKDAFISAAERDIYTGDSLYISIITKDGIQEEKFALRRD
jgi:20S proteasome subunit beta 6